MASAKLQIDPSFGVRNPLRILVAEDNLINQKVVLLFLRKLGYEADLAINGREVIRMVGIKPYDLILMDIQMPEMSGVDAALWIQENFAPEHRPWIVALTANVVSGEREKCLNAGMNDFLGKPLEIPVLIAALLKCKPREGRKLA